MTVKKALVLILLASSTLVSVAQDSTRNKPNEKQQKISALAKQEEEGILTYKRQNIFGIQLRTNGYGVYFEHGRSRSPRLTNLYLLELTEIKHPKEEKEPSGDGFLSGSFIYGKINNFYQAKLGFGQQYIFGQKGNKNGVAVMAAYQGGVSVGMLKPYYVSVVDGTGERDVKYESADSINYFLAGSKILGASGIGKGWDELKINPGVFVKTSLRFDFGRFNETVKAIELGLSLEGYSKEVAQLARVEKKRLFMQGHVAILFGRRK
jgi:hypothetical protein